MTWVALFDNQRTLPVYVELHVLPVAGEADYRCVPEGMLSLESVVEVSKELDLGAIRGWVEGYRWYRQVKKPSREVYHD